MGSDGTFDSKREIAGKTEDWHLPQVEAGDPRDIIDYSLGVGIAIPDSLDEVAEERGNRKTEDKTKLPHFRTLRMHSDDDRAL